MTKLNNFDASSIWNSIKESLKDHLGKASSTRINGYWMSILFTLCVLCCIAVEITSAITEINKGATYSVSNQLIAICVLILGQQALLFNLKRKSEDTSFPTVEKLNEVVNTNNTGAPINLSDGLPSDIDINKEQQSNAEEAEGDNDTK